MFWRDRQLTRVILHTKKYETELLLRGTTSTELFGMQQEEYLSQTSPLNRDQIMLI